eukprot:1158756-Pelagomonas_calceolata.AAC.5
MLYRTFVTLPSRPSLPFLPSRNKCRNASAETLCITPPNLDIYVGCCVLVGMAAESSLQLTAAHPLLLRFQLYLAQAQSPCTNADSCTNVVSISGGGKSLCYTLPALCANGVVVVVSPLIGECSTRKTVPMTILTTSWLESQQGSLLRCNTPVLKKLAGKWKKPAGH